MTSRNTIAALALITISAASPAALADEIAITCTKCVDGTYVSLQLVGSLQQDRAGTESLQPIGFLATMTDGSTELADLGIDFADTAVDFEWAVAPADTSASMAAVESVLSSRGAVVVVSLMGQGGYEELIGENGSGSDWLIGQNGTDWLIGNNGTDWLIGENDIIGENGTDWLIGNNGAVNADFLMGQNGMIGQNGTVPVQPLGLLDGDDLLPVTVELQDGAGVVFAPVLARSVRAAAMDLGTVWADDEGYLNVDATSVVDAASDGSFEVDAAEQAASNSSRDSSSSTSSWYTGTGR
jgi:hypothetical protein